MIALKVIVILLLLSLGVLLTQASVKIGPVSGTKTEEEEGKGDGSPIAKKQEVFLPSPRELYDDYRRRYDYPVNNLPAFRARYRSREPISMGQQFPLSSSVMLKNDEQSIEEYIPRRTIGYDGDLVSSRDDSNNQFLDAQDYENMLERNGNYMIEDQEKRRTALEGVPSRLPLEHAAKYQEVRPFKEVQDTRVAPASPVTTPQDLYYSEFIRARPVVDNYLQRIWSPDEAVQWQQEAIDLRAEAEALKAKEYLKHLIEEVGPTVTLKQVLDKYGPKVASLFSELQYASGKRFPNPINETKLSSKPAETKQRKHQKLSPQIHQEDVSKEMGSLKKANRSKSNLKTLELASEVTKEANDFIKIVRWFNKYYKSFRYKTSKVDNITKGNSKDKIKKKKVRIEKIIKNGNQAKGGTWNYKKIENILNTL